MQRITKKCRTSRRGFPKKWYRSIVAVRIGVQLFTKTLSVHVQAIRVAMATGGVQIH
jgi:hypothetical protein